MTPDRAPKQTLFSSVEYGEGKEEDHTTTGEIWEWRSIETH